MDGKDDQERCELHYEYSTLPETALDVDRPPYANPVLHLQWPLGRLRRSNADKVYYAGPPRRGVSALDSDNLLLAIAVRGPHHQVEPSGIRRQPTR